jgi:manganese/zinc/iron transport system substrate-binding protein
MTKIAAVVALALVTAGCDTDILNETGTSLSSRQVKIVATTTIVADLVEQVGGERVDVQTLMEPGVDPHRYRATPADVEAFAEADAVFYNGLGLDARLEHGFERMEYRALPFAVTRGIAPDRLLASPGAAGADDPHVWFDVELWRRAARQVRDDLISLDRANAAVYRDNAERYDRELVELDGWVRRETARIPADERVVPAAHPAFAYFARAYGFRLGGSDDRPAGRLFFDALGYPGTPAGSYVGMVRHNVETLVAGNGDSG